MRKLENGVLLERTTRKFVNPLQIGVGEDGTIYVSDLGTKRVQKFQSSGEYILDWGSSGKQSGEFYYPAGIAVS